MRGGQPTWSARVLASCLQDVFTEGGTIEVTGRDYLFALLDAKFIWTGDPKLCPNKFVYVADGRNFGRTWAIRRRMCAALHNMERIGVISIDKRENNCETWRIRKKPHYLWTASFILTLAAPPPLVRGLEKLRHAQIRHSDHILTQRSTTCTYTALLMGWGMDDAMWEHFVEGHKEVCANHN